jgi:putative DNA primase/helicase
MAKGTAMSDHIESFRSAIVGAGLTAPDTIEADGKLHRFSSNGRKGDDAGYYSLHLDGIAAGVFGCWRSGLQSTWKADSGRKLTKEEAAAQRAALAEMQRQRDEAKQVAQESAATKTVEIVAKAAEASSDHHYLLSKGIMACGALQLNDALVIPVRIDGKPTSLQFIGPDGTKRFLTGGAIQGGYFSIGTVKDAPALLICEGFATGASLHEATGLPVAVAFNAGNLEAVAKALRRKLPDKPMLICADDDVETAGNPGRTKAEAAATATGAAVVFPLFAGERGDKQTDFNDLHQAEGLEAVRRIIMGAVGVIGGSDTGPQEATGASDDATHQPSEDDAPAGEYARDVSLIRASDVTPEAIAWLWNGWLAAGKMHVFGGAPGTGKTTISMGLAATVTTGGRWPDGTRSIAGNVVIWSGEDDPADTLIPRLALSGADLSRVYFIADIREGNERRSFDPARDMEPLRRKLAEIGGVKLLIVDPVVSAIAGDSHKNAEVRRGLQPLVDLAGSMRCALLGITHFSKGTGGRDPVERLTGSLAFGALARVVLVAAKHQEEGEDGRTVRLFCRAKSNIGPDDGGFEYDLHQAELKTYPGIFASSVLWGEAVEGAARELLATADATGDDGEGGTLADAKRFLADLLHDGPLPTKTIKADADGAGYSWATIRRAQKALGIEPVKEGMKAGWVWRMPGQDAARAILENAKMLKNPEDAQQKEVSTFGEIEHLRSDSGAVEVEI